MKTRMIFSMISIIVVLLISLCAPTLTPAQRMSQNVMMKDIPSRHIDGGGTLTLDVSKDLGITESEALTLVNALPAKETDGTGVTIEVLKPANSTVHSKALVIRQIKPKLTGQLVDGGTTGIKLRELWGPDEDQAVLPEDQDIIPVIQLHHTVLIEFYNTTKSRINLQNWQIRFTYGAKPDATDATISRVIDTMSNVDDRDWGHRHPQDPKRILNGNVSMSRHIDVERLNDPTKTYGEQLSAISDGTRQTGWDISEVPREEAWIEVHKTNENGKTWKYLIELRGEDQPSHEPETIILPELIVPSPPTDDR